MPTQTFDYRKMLQVLLAHRAEFIVVGGVAAVLQGAPVTTSDLDIVHARTPENIPRMVAALTELDAIYRERLDRRIRPTARHMASPGHNLLRTKFGSLDVLGTITKNRGYDDLLKHSKTVNLTKRKKFLLLDLEMLITVKEETGRAIDKAVLPVLRNALQRIQNETD